MSRELRVEFDASPSGVKVGAARRGPYEVRPSKILTGPSQRDRELAAEKEVASTKTVDVTSEPRISKAEAEAARLESSAEWLVIQTRVIDLLRKIEVGVDEFQQEIVREVKGIEPAAVDLAFAIAGRIMAREIERERFDISDLVRAGLDRVLAGQRDGHKIHILLAPSDRELIGRVVGERIEDSSRVDFEVDPAMNPNSCVIRCDMRRVRVDLENELQRMKESILGGGASDG